MAYLEYLIGDERHETKLDTTENTVGRARDCTVQLLHDPELSRVHCTVRRDADGGFAVVDEGSTNGTFLNDEQVGNEPRALKEGDRIRIGTTVLVFREQEVGRTAMIFSDVEKQMDRGDGYHTILDRILHRRKKP
jgi:pSer/pThr/pTyr-binding forkhead associated (FHA) protein